MNTLNALMKSLIASTLALGLALSANPASAGKGSNYSRIMSSIGSGSVDAIMAELEKAEDLICPRCVDPVMALLDHDEYPVRQVAAWWFARRPGYMKEITELGKGLLVAGTSLEVRNSADWLGTFNRPSAIASLGPALDRSGLDADARVAITRALGTIANPAANPYLVQAMGDSSELVRLQAVTSYRRVRNQSDAAPLVPLLGDTSAKVRGEAAAVIGQFRYAAARADLESALADGDDLVRQKSAWALGRIGSRDSLSALQAALSAETSVLVKGYLKAAIGQLSAN